MDRTSTGGDAKSQRNSRNSTWKRSAVRSLSPSTKETKTLTMRFSTPTEQFQGTKHSDHIQVTPIEESTRLRTQDRRSRSSTSDWEQLPRTPAETSSSLIESLETTMLPSSQGTSSMTELGSSMITTPTLSGLLATHSGSCQTREERVPSQVRLSSSQSMMRTHQSSGSESRTVRSRIRLESASLQETTKRTTEILLSGGSAVAEQPRTGREWKRSQRGPSTTTLESKNSAFRWCRQEREEFTSARCRHSEDSWQEPSKESITGDHGLSTTKEQSQCVFSRIKIWFFLTPSEREAREVTMQSSESMQEHAIKSFLLPTHDSSRTSRVTVWPQSTWKMVTEYHWHGQNAIVSNSRSSQRNSVHADTYPTQRDSRHSGRRSRQPNCPRPQPWLNPCKEDQNMKLSMLSHWSQSITTLQAITSERHATQIQDMEEESTEQRDTTWRCRRHPEESQDNCRSSPWSLMSKEETSTCTWVRIEMELSTWQRSKQDSITGDHGLSMTTEPDPLDLLTSQSLPLPFHMVRKWERESTLFSEATKTNSSRKP